MFKYSAWIERGRWKSLHEKKLENCMHVSRRRGKCASRARNEMTGGKTGAQRLGEKREEIEQIKNKEKVRGKWYNIISCF